MYTLVGVVVGAGYAAFAAYAWPWLGHKMFDHCPLFTDWGVGFFGVYNGTIAAVRLWYKHQGTAAALPKRVS